MRDRLILIVLSTLITATALAQGPTDKAARDGALAARRAERDAQRAERMPSRPVTLRDPLPLPVTLTKPAGGPAAGESCPATKPCIVSYSVPAGRTLVVTALWSAQKIRCDDTSLAATPANGHLVSPWWQCTKTLTFEGAGAGFTGYLFATPDPE